jgi:hypothetical protein
MNELPASPEPEAAHPPTIPELIRQLLEELSTLFRQEVRLAAAQLAQALAAMLSGVTSLAVAAALLFAGLLLLLFAAVMGLALLVPAWLAAVLVGIAAWVLGAVLLWIGVGSFRAATVDYRLSIESMRKDKDVLLRRAHF